MLKKTACRRSILALSCNDVPFHALYSNQYKVRTPNLKRSSTTDFQRRQQRAKGYHVKIMIGNNLLLWGSSHASLFAGNHFGPLPGEVEAKMVGRQDDNLSSRQECRTACKLSGLCVG